MTWIGAHNPAVRVVDTCDPTAVCDQQLVQPACDGLQLTLFGFPQVALGGRTLTFARRGAVALLAYLALTQRVHSRDSLVALLADDVVDEKARRHLSNLLHELTGQLGGYLIVTRQTIALDSTRPTTLDVAAFEAALAAAQTGGDIGALQAAVDSFQHELLEGFGLRNAVAFDEWLLLERERLSGLLMQALGLLCEHYARRAEYAAGLACAARWMVLDPWDEAAHRQAMRLLAQSGRRHAALAQYDQCRRMIADLGVEPEDETTALYEQLRCAPVPPPHNLPPQPTPFIGRQRDLARLAAQLDDPSCRLMTIVGMGGMGKTRLALQAAARYVRGQPTLDTQRFPDGVYYIALDQLATGSSAMDRPATAAHSILSAIAQTFGIPKRATIDLATQVYGELRERAAARSR